MVGFFAFAVYIYEEVNTHGNNLQPLAPEFHPLFLDTAVLRDVLHNSSEGTQLDCSSVAHNATLLSNAPLCLCLPSPSPLLTPLLSPTIPQAASSEFSHQVPPSRELKQDILDVLKHFLMFRYYNFQTETKFHRIIKQMPIY